VTDKVNRRKFLKTAAVGAAGAGIASPAIAQTAPSLEWRMVSSFPKSLDTIFGAAETFSRVLSEVDDSNPMPRRGVMVYDIAVVNGGTRQTFDPSHPHADENGYVTIPAVSQADEMSLMIQTTRSYEANLVAMAAAQQMYSSALQVGRQA
jgi:flagellar basal-body rod protein FlgC